MLRAKRSLGVAERQFRSLNLSMQLLNSEQMLLKPAIIQHCLANFAKLVFPPHI